METTETAVGKGGILARVRIRVATALRSSFREGYRLRDLRADALAGTVVGLVALPLSMALAIASGVPPQHGLFAAIIGGAVIALLGGSAVQVSGPTAAFVVILAPIAAQNGVTGLLVATLLAGMLLVLMGMAGLGRMIQFIPYSVTIGFTAGIAVVLASLQLKDFLGLPVGPLPDHFIDRVRVLATAPGISLPDTFIGVLTLALLLVVPRITRTIPAPLIALTAAALAAFGLENALPGFHVDTIASRFGGIPRMLPAPSLPWLAEGAADLDVRALLLPAFAIAMLGAIESLLSAVVADGMTGRRHDPDAEIVAQGIGNILAPIFGGIATTGAIARTATNVRAGARSPLAAFLHAVFVLVAMLLFAPLLGHLPMAALAALLLLVAWNMSEIKHIARAVWIGPRSDTFVLLTCFGLTVIFDMVIAVSVGVVLAALLFMQRMANLTSVKLVSAGHPGLPEPLAPHVLVYDIGGPLFFGAAHKAASALHSIRSSVHVVVLDMRDVPAMDTTGLINLESAIGALHKMHIFVVIAGVQSQPLHLMARAGWRHRPWLVVLRSFDDAMALVRSLAPSDLPARPTA